MSLNCPGKAKHYIFYLITILLPIIAITYVYLEKKDQYIQKYLEKENVAYEAILSSQLETAQTIYKGEVNQPRVLEILIAAQSQDSSIRDDMRNQLYNLNSTRKCNSKGIGKGVSCSSLSSDRKTIMRSTHALLQAAYPGAKIRNKSDEPSRT